MLIGNRLNQTKSIPTTLDECCADDNKIISSASIGNFRFYMEKEREKKCSFKMKEKIICKMRWNCCKNTIGKYKCIEAILAHMWCVNEHFRHMMLTIASRETLFLKYAFVSSNDKNASLWCYSACAHACMCLSHSCSQFGNHWSWNYEFRWTK